MIKLLAFCLLMFYVAKCSDNYCEENTCYIAFNNQSAIISKNSHLTITQHNCSLNIETDKVNNEELVKLSMRTGQCGDFNDHLLSFHYNSPHGLKNISITLNSLNGSHCEVCDMCYKILVNETFEPQQKIFTICLIEANVTQLAIKATDGVKLYQQNLFIWNNKDERFLYSDSTSKRGMDTVHIAETDKNSSYYYILQRKTENQKMENLTYIYTNDQQNHTFLQSGTHWYKLWQATKTYPAETAQTETARTETVAAYVITILSILLVSSAIVVSLWFLSRVKERRLILIYCQCDRHSFCTNAVQKFQHFLNAHCMMHCETPHAAAGDLASSTDNENLLSWRSGTNGVIAFIPFPCVDDHDRSYEGEIHQLCERYRYVKNKIELNLSFTQHTNVTMIRSEWPKGSFKSFQLFEEFTNFVKYMHPFYLPSCLERYFRPQISEPHLSNLRLRNTFTNDHFREITDPKLLVPLPILNPERNPNINLNVFM